MTRSQSGVAERADTAALQRCAAGDTAGLEQLYTSYAPSCLRLARSILVDPHHAEDAVQEVYLDLWRQAGRFDGRRSSVRSWLLLLTHRKAVDRVRSEQRRTTAPLAPEHDRPDPRPGPDAYAIIEVLGEQTRQALAALAPVKREAMVLAYWGGYSQREIAGLTNTPVGTVKSRMHGALRELGGLLVADGCGRDCVMPD